jgi:hypothetical protein
MIVHYTTAVTAVIGCGVLLWLVVVVVHIASDMKNMDKTRDSENERTVMRITVRRQSVCRSLSTLFVVACACVPVDGLKSEYMCGWQQIKP